MTLPSFALLKAKSGFLGFYVCIVSLSVLIKRRNGVKLGLYEPPGATVCAEMSPSPGEEASFINNNRPVKGTVEPRLL